MIISHPQIPGSQNLLKAVETLKCSHQHLEELVASTKEAKEMLSDTIILDAVSDSISYWQWRSQQKQVDTNTGAELKDRDKNRLAYYAAKLGTICAMKSMYSLIDGLKDLIQETRANLKSTSLEADALLFFEAALVNCVSAELVLIEVETRLISLGSSTDWIISTTSSDEADGSKRTKPYPETERLYAPHKPGTNMHAWLKDLFDGYERKYFLHISTANDTNKPEVPDERLLTRFEVEMAKYRHDICSEYSYTYADIYLVEQGKASLIKTD